MVRNIVITWSSWTLWSYFSEKMRKSPDSRIIECSSKPWADAYFNPIVQDEEEIRASMGAVFDELETIDELHYFSGISDREFDSFPCISMRDAMGLLNVNLIWLHAIVSNFWHKLRGGTLFVYSSVRADRPWKSLLYAASKAGLNAYARGLANDFPERGIACVLLRLWPFRSKATEKLSEGELARFVTMTKSGKIGTPDEVYDAVSDIPRTANSNGIEVHLFPLR